MNIEFVKIEKLVLNEKNPRTIKDTKFAQLVQSVKDFPQMLEIRPIVVNEKFVILGGNMRYQACLEAGIKKVPIIKVSLTPEQEEEFMIKDNVSGGEWDFEKLATEWNIESVGNWGVDIMPMNTDVKFEPNLAPSSSATNVTDEDVKKKAEELEKRFESKEKGIDCICPSCGHEFKITE